MTDHDLPEAPSHLRDLIERLQAHGFEEVQSEHAAHSFGNVLRMFEREPVRIRVVRDRGDWSVEITAAGWPTHEHFGEDWVVMAPGFSEPE